MREYQLTKPERDLKYDSSAECRERELGNLSGGVTPVLQPESDSLRRKNAVKDVKCQQRGHGLSDAETDERGSGATNVRTDNEPGGVGKASGRGEAAQRPEAASARQRAQR